MRITKRYYTPHRAADRLLKVIAESRLLYMQVDEVVLYVADKPKVETIKRERGHIGYAFTVTPRMLDNPALWITNGLVTLDCAPSEEPGIYQAAWANRPRYGQPTTPQGKARLVIKHGYIVYDSHFVTASSGKIGARNAKRHYANLIAKRLREAADPLSGWIAAEDSF